ncbi:iron ABC transporter permease [Paenibacillus sp. N1-5-1-14]|uniref:FecCD family ABC transporter permease n=1 Tax=Paenibacillus radicibacter TaxID=2972488 RepID=UPI002158D117|nr:iron ABC transporter permease [Paenibacillus radicibacter]MCR8644932.1 iron ABC transporter permease [Paenibacillus radicibacter]
MNKQHLLLRNNKLGLSILIERKTLRVISILLLLLIVVCVFAIGAGSLPIHPWSVIQALFGQGDETHRVIINTFRLPRVYTAIMVGGSLAVAGAILQGMIRNPLASPDLIGITGGASTGAVTFLFFFGGSVSIHYLPIAAVLGAFIVTLLIYLLAWKRGVTPLRLVLIGIGFSAALSSLTYMMLISGPPYLATKALAFMTGSIYGASWKNDVFVLLPWVIVLLPLVWILSSKLNIQQLGDEIAKGIGSRVQLDRLFLLILAVALAGVAVAIGGAIAFIGLMAPHLARKLVGPSFGGLIPVAALVGAIILLLADLAARTLFVPLDIPAGVFTAGIGAPFFIYMLYHNRQR